MNIKNLWRLKPPKRLLSDFFVFDTETGKQFKNGSIQWELEARPEKFIFGVVYGLNYQKVIFSREQFITEFKHDRYKNKIVFAHNLEYDLTTLYDNPIENLIDVIWNNKLISCSNGNCFFADSVNIFGRVSLSVIGKMINIEKPSLGNESLYSERLGMDELNRCVIDCHILWLALFEMFEFAGAIKITQASLSLTYYRRFHQPFNLSSNENTKYFWNSYFGGRTEIFKMGKTHSKVIDINSSYPYAMKNIEFPNPRMLKVLHVVTKEKFINQILEHFEGCIECTVIHAPKWLGFLPVKKNNKLIFPIGEFSGCWNFNEIRFALDNDAIKIKSISRVIYGERMKTPFDSFVEFLYTERFKTKNEFEIYRIKIFMNSLYGKFAQRIKEEHIYLSNIDDNIDLIQDYQKSGLFIKLQMFNSERKDAYLVIKSKLEKSLSHSIPVFSSYITSFSRVHLLKKLLELENNVPVYCDTDSIFYEVENNHKDEYFLGGWKTENKIVTDIRGLKNYKYFKIENPKEVFHRVKGVPSKANKISDTQFKYKSMVHAKEGLTRNLDSGTWIDREKNIKGIYDKRILDKQTGLTKPIKL